MFDRHAHARRRHGQAVVAWRHVLELPQVRAEALCRRALGSPSLEGATWRDDEEYASPNAWLWRDHRGQASRSARPQSDTARGHWYLKTSVLTGAAVYSVGGPCARALRARCARGFVAFCVVSCRSISCANARGQVISAVTGHELTRHTRGVLDIRDPYRSE
jgi:hypothetical protein